MNQIGNPTSSLSVAPPRAGRRLHPWPLRIMHWINAVVMLVMITSGSVGINLRLASGITAHLGSESSAGARVIDAGRGYGRACTLGAAAAHRKAPPLPSWTATAPIGVI